MKKILTLALAAGMFSFYACGPSAEEKAAAEKATQDSIANADAAQKAAAEAAMQQAMADSMAKAAEAAKAQATADSIAAAEAGKGKGKKK